MPAIVQHLLRLALLSCMTNAAALSTDPVAASRALLKVSAQQASALPKPRLIAREAFMRQPQIIGVQLAPDARHLAYYRRDDSGRTHLWLQDIADASQRRVASDALDTQAVWSGDGQRLWLADAHGLSVFDVATQSSRRVHQWNVRRNQRLWMVDARTPRMAVIEEHVPAEVAAPYRYLLIDAQGASTLLHAAQWPLRSATLTREGKLAFVAAYDGKHFDTAIRHYVDGEGRELLRCVGIERCDVLAHDEAQRTLWLWSQHGQTQTALLRWREGKFLAMHRDPDGLADAADVLLDADGANWAALAYDGAHRQWYGRDAATGAQLGALRKRLPGANLQLTRGSSSDLWLVRARHATSVFDRWFLYRPARDQLQPLFADGATNADAIAAHELADAIAIDWRASDGMLLHGYVYLPHGASAAKAPLIAWLHGGPIARATDDYDSRIQTLVNRGYIVFVPNFRASTGYGVEYTRSAKGDVGHGRVLADIMDGLDFLLAQGIGDRDRQAVAGHSFGGYASLLALSHHPQRFRFAFAGAPPTDYGWIKQWQAEHDSEAIRGQGPPAAVQFAWHDMRPDDAPWRERMRRESPLAALPCLGAPVYLWAGANDTNVPLKSIANFAAEATRLGKPISLLIDPVASHAPRNALGSEAWMAQLERAASHHLGGAAMPLSTELERFLRQNLRIDSAHLLEDAHAPDAR